MSAKDGMDGSLPMFPGQCCWCHMAVALLTLASQRSAQLCDARMWMIRPVSGVSDIDCCLQGQYWRQLAGSLSSPHPCPLFISRWGTAGWYVTVVMRQVLYHDWFTVGFLCINSLTSFTLCVTQYRFLHLICVHISDGLLQPKKCIIHDLTLTFLNI